MECDWTVLCWGTGWEELEAGPNDQNLPSGAQRAAGEWGHGTGRTAAGSAWWRSARVELWEEVAADWRGRWG